MNLLVHQLKNMPIVVITAGFLQFKEGMIVTGLYKKALQLLSGGTEADDTTYTDLIESNGESGISPEDQKDIIKSINSMVQKTKIKVTPDLFKIKARKTGVVFPLIINIAAVIILICTVFGLYLFFQKSDAEMISSKGSLDTTSNIIIQQLKKQAQDELNRLNAEKSAIEQSLASVNENLQNLQNNMNAEIDNRVKALQDQINLEMDAERRRLLAAGVSQADIDRQLEQLRSEKDAQLEAQMAAIRRAAEAERKKQEEQLLVQRSQFNQALAQANNDLVATEEKYSLELKRQEQTILVAEQKIQELSQQREKFALINEQIIGYYKLVQNDIVGNKFDIAQIHLDELNGYLAGPAVMSVPDIARRYDVELFVIKSLKDLVTSQKNKTSPQTNTIITQAEAITEIRTHVLDAEAAFRSGNKKKADEEYLKALQLIPEINQSHTYFIEQLKDVERFRTTQVDKLLATAQAAYNAKQYAQALTTYGRVLGYLPSSQATNDIVNQISTAGYMVESASAAATLKPSPEPATVSTAPVNSAEAGRIIAQANTQANNKQYDAAIQSYLSVITGYPQSTQVQEAVKGIDVALQGKNKEASERIEATTAPSADLKVYQQEIAALKKQVQEYETRIYDIESGSSASSEQHAAEIAALRRTISEKESEISDLKKQSTMGTEELTSEIAALKQQIKTKETEIATLNDSAKVERETRTVEIAGLKKDISQKETEITELNRASEKKIEKYEQEIAALKKTLDAGKDEKQATINNQKERISKLEAFNADLQEQITALNASITANTAEIGKLKVDGASLQELLEKEQGRRSAVETEIEELKIAYSDYIAVREAYSDYARRETAVIKTGSLEELAIGKSYLDSFLASESLGVTFPGLLDRIKRYDNAFEQAGRTAAISDMLDIIEAMNKMPAIAQRIQYIDARLKENDDELFGVLLRSLRALVQK
ncbi:MAG: hypothetical protein JW904_11250 [Spirochaetales bacterium]|nr:hypothetical protein [Spirochaetales bacterium]